jgi:hypothetical protein
MTKDEELGLLRGRQEFDDVAEVAFAEDKAEAFGHGGRRFIAPGDVGSLHVLFLAAGNRGEDELVGCFG